MEGFSPRQFMDGLQGAEIVHIQCSACHQTGEGIEVPCHRVLDTRLFASAMAEGTRTFVLHGLSECGGCPKGDAAGHLAETRERLSQWFGAQAVPQLVAAPAAHGRQTEKEPPETARRMSRRGWFRLLGARAAEAGSTLISPAVQPGGPSQEAGRVRAELEGQRPAEYQALFSSRVAGLPWTGDMLPWRGRSILEWCTACLACARRCPTGALRAEEEGRRRTISFEPALCTDCGLCERLCPEGAVAVEPPTSTQALISPRRTLVQRVAAECLGCGQAFWPRNAAERHCPVCSDEEAMLASWMHQAAADADGKEPCRGPSVAWSRNAARGLGRDRGRAG